MPKGLAIYRPMPHTRDMNKTIAYSNITVLAPIHFDRCCGERMLMCPSCGTDLCVFCMDACDECESEIDWTK